MIEKLNKNHDIVAMAEDCVDKINEIIDYLNERAPFKEKYVMKANTSKLPKGTKACPNCINGIDRDGEHTCITCRGTGRV